MMKGSRFLPHLVVEYPVASTVAYALVFVVAFAVVPVFSCLIAGAVSPAFAAEAGAAGAAPITLEVDAGGFERARTPLRWELPAELKSVATVKLVVAESGKEVPAQVDALPRPAVVWMLEAPLERGAKRRYRLEAAPSAVPVVGALPAVRVVDAPGGQILVRAGEKDVFVYNAQTVTAPAPVPAIFARSGYLHPMYSPSGAVITDDFPANHLHHHGLWMPWSQTIFEGRATNFWEQARGEGKVEAVGLEAKVSGPVFGGFRARLRFLDLKAPGGPKPVLDETWDLKVYATGGPFLIDFVSRQSCAGASPLTLKEYRYGGFGFRGAKEWDGADGVAFLTSEGKTRLDGHATRARWCQMLGKIGGRETGIVFFGHSANFRAPQGMRIHPTEPFFNFAPCWQGDFEIRPDLPLEQSYRMLVHDADPGREAIERVWNDYAEPPRVTRLP